MLLTGRMSIKRFVVYVIAQFCGAFLAAAIIFLLYLDALKVYEPGMYSMDTAGTINIIIGDLCLFI
jgi:glycerol uptake facilitator-like aquaporin